MIDFNGRLIKRCNNVGSELNAGEISSGAYLLILKLKNRTHQTEKFIKA